MIVKCHSSVEVRELTSICQETVVWFGKQKNRCVYLNTFQRIFVLQDSPCLLGLRESVSLQGLCAASSSNDTLQIANLRWNSNSEVLIMGPQPEQN